MTALTARSLPAAIFSVVLAFGLASCSFAAPPQAPATASTVLPTPDPYVAPPDSVVAGLPEVKYDAVIPGLLAFGAAGAAGAANAAGASGAAGAANAADAASAADEAGAAGAIGSSQTFHLQSDSPLYGADRQTAVARFAAKNFLGDATVVVPVRTDGPWTLVFTPARQQLPSANHGNAPAQTTAWIRSSLLIADAAAGAQAHIEVSLSKQTLSIVGGAQPAATFAVGVGAPDTPTPTGVTGYIQARYLDPAQGETVYPIQLTSLHSAGADEPYGGADGGLIGVHFEEENTGEISHGCIRLPADAITAVNALPLGALITITP